MFERSEFICFSENAFRSSDEIQPEIFFTFFLLSA
jgi:hypothetical protein